MKSHWRKLLSLLPAGIEKKSYQQFFAKEHRDWIKNGQPLPVSNLSKQQVLLAFQKRYGISTFVETGTYLGDTTYAMADHFQTLYSIELSGHFHALAKKRFQKFAHIHLLLGDSAEVLKKVVPELKSRAIFWLDGHYSGGLTAKGEKECPVFEELTAIFASPHEHLIFIDDARLFVGKNDYPTIEALQHFVSFRRAAYTLTIENDCIRLLPSQIVEFNKE